MLLGAVLVGCPADRPATMPHDLPIKTRCRVALRSAGTLRPTRLEQAYLPRVLACELGRKAEPAALKAQAIAARTYAYYVTRIERRALVDSERDQVYRCRGRNLENFSRDERARIRRAVAATRGLVLVHRGGLLAAFFVAGSATRATSCIPSREEFSVTEQHVTVNAGKSAAAVRPTNLGHPRNPRNRGCLSQLGARCLARRGYGPSKILRFYYGEDIDEVQTTGKGCASPQPRPSPPPAAATQNR